MSKPIKHRKKWRIRWLDEAGRRRAAVYASQRQAEQELRRRPVEVDAIKAGLADGRVEDHTFDELCDYWLGHRAPAKRSGRDDGYIIARHLRPDFGRLQLRDISFGRIEAFKARRQHLAPNTIRNQLTLLGTMLRLAVKLRWLAAVPDIDKPKVRQLESDFSYLRTEDEIRRFLTAAREHGLDAFMLYATALWTGMRQGELAGLRWDDVRFSGPRIVVQRSYTRPTKTSRVRYVPILDVLLPELRRWRLLTPGQLVFPNLRGNMHQHGASIFDHRLHRVLDAAGFERPGPGARRVHYITFHDLRHTFASHWVMRRGDIFRLQKILGHKSIEMTMRYAHLAPDAFAQDLDRFDGLGGTGAGDDHDGAVIALK